MAFLYDRKTYISRVKFFISPNARDIPFNPYFNFPETTNAVLLPERFSDIQHNILL
jgi:hypothetical protein